MSTIVECYCESLLDIGNQAALKDHMISCERYKSMFFEFDMQLLSTLANLKNVQEVMLLRTYIVGLFDSKLADLGSRHSFGSTTMNTGSPAKVSVHQAGSITQRKLVMNKLSLMQKNAGFPQPNMSIGKPSARSARDIDEDDDFDFEVKGQSQMNRPGLIRLGTVGRPGPKPASIIPKNLQISTVGPSSMKKSFDFEVKRPDEVFNEDNCILCKAKKPWDSLYQMECGHIVCQECVDLYLAKKLISERKVVCLAPKCHGSWTLASLVQIYSQKRSGDAAILANLRGAESQMANLATCQKCNQAFMFEPGDANDSPDKDAQGLPLRQIYRRLYAEDRFKCPFCSCEQCKICATSPYHVGFNCCEFKTLVPCRYCDEPLDHEVDVQKMPLSDICTTNPDCMNKADQACSHILNCGHRCGGYKGEKKHPSCIIKSCTAYIERRCDVCTYCNEGLSKGPIVQLKCKDIFHYKCLELCLKKKWCTKRITFGYIKCPNCKERISTPVDCGVRSLLEPAKELYSQIESMSENKLYLDKRESDSQLSDPGHRFYRNPKEYSMAIYACYQCSKCKKPFIGGQVNCEAEANADDGSEKDNYVCIDCSGGSKCSIHGTDAMVHKCKYCCEVATWFCWGTTHFCNTCHEKQYKDRSFAKNGPFPTCDRRSCKFKGNHPPAPSALCAGCAICGLKI